jgi:hypothetical protein
MIVGDRMMAQAFSHSADDELRLDLSEGHFKRVLRKHFKR